MRALIDATIRTEVGADEVAAAEAEIDAATARLRSEAKPRLTGTTTLRYLRTTRLGNLHAEARIARTEGAKTYAVGHLADEEGITVEAEGVFIQPRWARD